MVEQLIRIGIVGAGANTRLRHIPGFRKIEGVGIAGVVNSSDESTQRAARELDIPRTFSDWKSLVEDDEIDAVMIGTWPNLHCEVTCAALAAGKHVLTEARMARNLDEARRMRDAAAAHPDLTTQIVPSPLGLECGAAVKELIDDEDFGELRELVVIGATDSFWDDSQPVHWRQQSSLSGKNVLALGIMHETVQRWCPPPLRVFAQGAIFSRRTSTEDGTTVKPDIPDSLQVLTELDAGDAGGRGMYHLSGIALHGPPLQIHLYGSGGTIKVEFGSKERVLFGRAGEDELREVEIPAAARGGWRVEEEFISAIRGQEEVRLTDFATGVQYMEFTEAVSRSLDSGETVTLPLEE